MSREEMRARMMEIMKENETKKEEEKRQFVEKLNKIQYDKNCGFGGWRDAASIVKEIDGRYYNFSVSRYVAGANEYSYYIMDTFDDTGHHPKRELNINKMPKKYQSHLNELLDYLKDKQ